MKLKSTVLTLLGFTYPTKAVYPDLSGIVIMHFDGSSEFSTPVFSGNLSGGHCLFPFHLRTADADPCSNGRIAITPGKS